MSEFPLNAVGMAMSPAAAAALAGGTVTLSELLGWEAPDLPPQEIPRIIDPRLEEGDVAIFRDLDTWRRRCREQELWDWMPAAMMDLESSLKALAR